MSISEEKTKDIVKILKLTQLHQSPYQGRFMDILGDEENKPDAKQLKELTQSIEEIGLMQPIIVRPVENGYEILDGHRRVLAVRELGRGQIKAIIRECTEREAQIMTVVGNLQRKNLSPIEQAIAYKKLLDAGIFKDKRELSRAIGKDETFIGDLVNTLNMDSRIIDDLAKKNLVKDLRILRLIRLADKVDETGKSDKQWNLYQKVIWEKLKRNELSKLLRTPVNKTTTKHWTVTASSRAITFRIEVNKFTEEQKKQLIQLIGEKLAEIKI